MAAGWTYQTRRGRRLGGGSGSRRCRPRCRAGRGLGTRHRARTRAGNSSRYLHIYSENLHKECSRRRKFYVYKNNTAEGFGDGARVGAAVGFKVGTYYTIYFGGRDKKK